MQLKDLTKEQVEKICNYLEEKYNDPEKTDLKSQTESCRHCPFGIPVDGTWWRECYGNAHLLEIPKEFEEILKETK